MLLGAEESQEAVCHAWMNQNTIEIFLQLQGSGTDYAYAVFDAADENAEAGPLESGTAEARVLGNDVHFLKITLDDQVLRDRLRIVLDAGEAGSVSAYVMKSDVPEKLTAEPIGKTGIRLTWQGSLGKMTAWKVQLFEQSRMSKPAAEQMVRGNSAEFKDLQPDMIYRAIVSPCLELKDAEGNVSESFTGAKTSLFNLNTVSLFRPAAVSNLKAAGGECQVRLSWTPSAKAEGYDVYYYDGGKQAVTSRIGTTSSASYTINAIPAGTYSFAVIAFRKTADGEPVCSETSAPARAAVTYYRPEAVSDLKAVGDNQQITLSWKAAKYAGGYNIYAYDPATKKVGQKIGATHDLKYTVKGLENGKTYHYVVYGYRIANGYAGLGNMSRVVSCQAGFDGKVPAPAWFNVENSKNGNKLTWAGVNMATGYYIWRYNYNSSKYEQVAALGKVTSWTDKSIKTTRGKFKYKICACRDYIGKIYSSPGVEKVIFGASDMDAVNNKIHPIYYRARINQGTRLYQTFNAKEKIGTISAGERVTVMYRRTKRCKIRRASGQICYIKTSALTYTSEIYTSRDYDTADKEFFVNYKGYSSKSGYLIWISTYSQHVNIFKGSKGKWKLFRSCLCATGKISTPSPLGGFTLYAKKSAQKYSSTYYRYVSKFKEKNAMHTRVRYYGGGFVDSRLGLPLSNGCVRLHDDNAHYIYDHVPKGTSVIVY